MRCSAFDTASNWTEFREAARWFAVPSQNLVYADTSRQHRLPGARRRARSGEGNRDGDYPAAGWLPQNDWSGRYVPFDSLPSVLNPAGGLHRDRQPGRHRARLPVAPLGLARTRATAASGSAT